MIRWLPSERHIFVLSEMQAFSCPQTEIFCASMPPRRASFLQKEWRSEFLNCPPPFLKPSDGTQHVVAAGSFPHPFSLFIDRTPSLDFPMFFSIWTGPHPSFYHAAHETQRSFRSKSFSTFLTSSFWSPDPWIGSTVDWYHDTTLCDFFGARLVIPIIPQLRFGYLATQYRWGTPLQWTQLKLPLWSISNQSTN